MSSRKRRIVFIDHGYHKHTKSTDFIFDILARYADVIRIYDESWNGDPAIDVKAILAQMPDQVFFVQLRPRRVQLKGLKHIPVTWVPMRDDVSWEKRFWKRLRRYKVSILAFCKEIDNHAQQMNIRSFYTQYFPNAIDHAKSAPRDTKGVRLLFWQRVDKPDWATVKSLLGDTAVESVTLKLNSDPGFSVLRPSNEDCASYNIHIEEGWLPADKYQQLIDDCDIFVAPRNVEGIGMANLEAMAYGKCVLAANAPTANEYIRHYETGILYDPNNPIPVDFSNVHTIGSNAHELVMHGRKAWLESVPKMLSFLGVDINNI